MARKKKPGTRANGIQSKNGKLYIVTTAKVLQDGKLVFKNKWTSTGLKDTPENVKQCVLIRQQIISREEPLMVDRDISTREYVDYYLSIRQRELADSTYASYCHRAKHIADFFGDVRVREITRHFVEQFLDHLYEKEHLQPHTVKDIKLLLGNILKRAEKDGVVDINPAKDVSLNKVLTDCHTKPKKDDTFFSYAEAIRFLEIIESHQMYELFYVALFFALRRAEVLGIKWNSIDFSKKELCIYHTVTKGTKVVRRNATKTVASTRVFPINDDIINLFEELKRQENINRKVFGNKYQENDYVFKHKDGSLFYPDTITDAFKAVIIAHCELPQRITLHGLRVSCASILIHEGYDIKTIQKWLGHKDVHTTLAIYAMVKEKESKKEVLQGLHEIMPPKKYMKNES